MSFSCLYIYSDRSIATFTRRKGLEAILSQLLPDDLNRFNQLTDTIGGIAIWLSNRVDRQMTINNARGCNNKIADRFDLTVECIRRYYRGEYSPHYETLKRYTECFLLFDDFKGYIDFFLLQDIVSDDYSTVKLATSFDDFNTSPIPSGLEEYRIYKQNTTKFVEARNARIASLY